MRTIRNTIHILLLTLIALTARASTFDSVRVSVERRPLKEQFEVMEYYADSLLSSDPFTAVPFTQEAIRIAHERGDKVEEGYLLNSLSKAYLALGEFDKSGEYARQALELNIDVHHDYEIARTYNTISVTYNYMGLYTNAMEYSLKALLIYTRLEKKNQAAIMLNSIGTIYLKLGQYDKAAEHFTRSLRMMGRKDTTKFGLLVFNNIASIQTHTGRPDSALAQFERLLALARRRKETGTEAYTLYLIGEAYSAKNQYVRALAAMRRSYELSSLVHEEHGNAEALLGIARVYSRMGCHRQVLATLDEAIPYCRKVKAFEFLRLAFDLQRRSFERMGDISRAYRSLRDYTELTDSVFTIAEKFGIANAKFTTDLDQKEKEIARLKHDTELAEESSERKEYLIYALAIFVIIVVSAAVALMFMYRKAKRLHHIEAEQKQKIESLFSELSKVVGDRDLADQQARDLQRKFQAVWEKSVDGMRLTDKDGRVLMVNEAFCRMVGMKREELTDFPLSIIYAEKREDTILREYRERFAARTVETYFEREIVLKDNRRLWFEVTNTYIDIEDQPLLLLSIFRDTTNRKMLEEQLVQSQKLEGIGTLAGGIAHDFNNLLAMILGSAEMLKEQIDGLPQLKKYVDRIVEASVRGTSISRQLLIFSRPDQAEFKPISLSQTIGSLHEMLTHFLPKSIEIVTQIESADDVIMGDAGQIQQALLNLAINAGDAMLDRRGTLTIGIHRVERELLRNKFSSVAGQQYIALTVSDTGIGMDESIRQKIFDPFFTTKERTKGTGLGLSSVHGIVKNHHGFIDVDSVPGRGTVFTLYFPMAGRQEQTGADLLTHQRPLPATVLLVDDERIIRETVGEFMIECGYTVHVAADGNEAIELYRKYRDSIDIVVTDLGMPHMGGEELVKRLQSIDPGVKIIVSSGYLDGMSKNELLCLGVKDVLAKPVKIHEIQMSINAILASSPEVH